MREKAYISRIMDDELSELLKAVQAVALEGPKGIGKTASAECSRDDRTRR